MGEVTGRIGFVGPVPPACWRLETTPPMPVRSPWAWWCHSRYFARRIDAVAFAKRKGIRLETQ